MSNIKSVAVLGIGKMGSAMTKELVAAGYQVTIWNRNHSVAEQLAMEINSSNLSVSLTSKTALENADLAICVFTNGVVTQSVLLDDPNVLEDAKSNLIIVDMGTSGVESAHALSKALASKKLSFIDAPVSGSVATIAAHQLLVMASGDESTIDQARPVFSAFAKKTAFIGQAGAGQAMKLAVNLIVHSLNAAVSEALALATANGIEASAAYDVLEESVVAAPFVKYKRAAFLDTSAPVAMRIDTVGKDLGLILGLGKESGVDLRAASGIAELYQQAASAGYEAQDMASLFRFIQNLDENVI